MAISGTRLSWLRVPSEADTPAEVKELWEKPLERLGFVPNVLRVYALRPRHLELWNAFYEELMRGDSALSKVQREMIGSSSRRPTAATTASSPTPRRCES